MQPLSNPHQISKLPAIGAALALMAMSSEVLAADAVSEQIPEPAFDSSRFDPQQAGPKWGLIIGARAMYEPEYE
jgi:outer membrane protein